jgi:NhaA family Na+:H+ antiporter
MRSRPLFDVVLRPIQEFFRLEAASGLLLMGAAVVALILANSPLQPVYQSALAIPLTLGGGGAHAHLTLGELINDGLMTVFFFVVGMEIKRELVVGELRTPARALLPGVAALGGMVLPALIYAGFNRGTPGSPGWGIPMATDIAFCVGCLTLLKDRVPHGLKVFLIALAIFDDMGGILVIALFYGSGLHLTWLLVALALGGVLVAMNRLYVQGGLWWALAGAALWYALHHSGVHATIAGVVLGLAVPALPRRPLREVLRELHQHVADLISRPEDRDLESAEVLMIEEKLEDLEPPLTRFVHHLHPWVAFGVMPVFALANSGVRIDGAAVAALGTAVPLGTALGLFAGKQLGIFLFTAAAVRLGLAPMPGGASHAQLYGVAVVGGIGFTVALFIAQLAFPGQPALLDQAKLGILLGSLISGLVGVAVLRFSGAPGASSSRPGLAPAAAP